MTDARDAEILRRLDELRGDVDAITEGNIKMGNGTTTEVEASIAGQKFRVTGHDVNMLFTVIGVVLSACIAYVVYDHQQDSRQTGQAFVGAVKEQTVAIREATSVQREQTCLLKFEERVRKDNAEFCKQITRQ